MYNPVLDGIDLSNLPRPQGYKILIAVPTISDRTEGGIILPDQLKKAEETAAIVGKVLELGPDCYFDKEKFPTGPWCQVGDWVMYRSYSGIRLKKDGWEFRLINDDSVEATVPDPEKVERA